MRNNNPGNIRHDGVSWKGEVKGNDKSFKTFETMAWGVRAIFHLLNNYRAKYGLDTIEGMIKRWAPENENDTKSYMQTVSKLSGVPVNSRLTTTNKDVMIPIVRAMIKVENGEEVYNPDLNIGWLLFIQNRQL